ncbi:MAG: amino acid permease-associated region [Cyanobacteria bacterium RYN_339]|nr:amino acid permease-associated region [Cyanobacteria bacterium RYN_339]
MPRSAVICTRNQASYDERSADLFLTTKRTHQVINQLLNRKPFEAAMEEKEGGLKRTLGALDLTVLGIGAIIGAGIFVIAGRGAQAAGPGIMLSFVLVGIACLCAALCYAELASMIPAAGSAYAYTYATLGEFPAWLIGWFLVLEYSVASAAVASGWSGYFNKILHMLGAALPDSLTHSPLDTTTPGMMNLPAICIVLAVTVLLVLGVRESARVNALFVALKIAVLVVFIVVALPYVKPGNWDPFLPFGWPGVVKGGAMIFFAYIGFDAVATTAEECKNPQRDLPIGILGSLGVCTVFYIIVAAVMTGMVPFAQLDDPAPLAKALSLIGKDQFAALISVGAIFGLSSVIMVLMMGMPRIWFAMARDGLLPPVLGAIHPKFRTPWIATIINGVFVAAVTGLLRLNEIAEMTNIGTLSAFIVVAIGVWILRVRSPEMKRGFTAPLLPVTALITIVSCSWMMWALDALTWKYFAVWTVLGIIVYFVYGVHNSVLRPGAPAKQQA